MDDMGMDMAGMEGMAGMAGMEGMEGMDHSSMPGMGGSGAMEPTTAPAPVDCAPQTAIVARHDGDGHGAGNTMVAAVAKSRVTDPGVGLRDASWRVLTYSQLRRAPELRQLPPPAPPAREIVLHLTGNMERYMWSFDGEQFRHDTPPIVLQRGERVRFVLINDTMMAHPIHLHGVFFELEVGACGDNPWKHTVNVKPAERVSFVVTPDEVGRWAFHCHILYHMEAGMFRVVEVQP
jgi:FtsP/CotA-like multicopper oxidase with cupredoxin domain